MSIDPESIQRYPLQWPLGWARTSSRKRQRSTFTQKRQNVATEGEPSRRAAYGTVTTNVATQRLERQLESLGGADPVLSTNVRLRLDGRPYSDQDPEDPGVAVYFRFKGRATVLACDRYLRVADNIAAVAAHIDALRRIERYGVGTIEQALAGYRALPADTAADWRSVFGFPAQQDVTEDQLQTKYRERASLAHPDKGGTDEMMMHVNRARDFALQEIRDAH